MKIFITLLLLIAIIMTVTGFVKKNRKMTVTSAVISVSLLVLYMVLFQI
ncbi:hypothetical protein [Alteribacter aurantiacus]|nr:hypothetical protein [Alteribacter aurantiacus]